MLWYIRFCSNTTNINDRNACLTFKLENKISLRIFSEVVYIYTISIRLFHFTLNTTVGIRNFKIKQMKGIIYAVTKFMAYWINGFLTSSFLSNTHQPLFQSSLKCDVNHLRSNSISL